MTLSSLRVLVVEDSPVNARLLEEMLSADPRIRVVGIARTGEEAVEAVAALRPDVVTMDVVMPGIGGLEATRRIMETHPVPIVIVSGTVSREEVATTFEALQAGAVAAIPRPAGPGHPEYAATARELLRAVTALSEVRLVRRWGRAQLSAGKTDGAEAASPAGVAGGWYVPPGGVRVVAIGGSTGAPEALKSLLGRLSPGFPWPVLVVQHLAPGFVEGFVQWLDRELPLPVRLGAEEEPAVQGTIYLAPDGSHLAIDRGGILRLSRDAPENLLRPSVGHLFRAVRCAFQGSAAAILLSGMGSDGAPEMKQLYDAGALTVVQDEASSVIYGMPGAAAKLGAARYRLSPPGIGDLLERLAHARR